MSWVDWIWLAAMPLLGAVSKKAKRPVSKKTSSPARSRTSRASTRARKAKRAPVTRRAARSARRVTRPQAAPARGRTATVSVVVPSPPPSAPVPPTQPSRPIGRAILISPENEKWVDSRHPTFRWLSVGGATRYEIIWSEDPTLTTHHTLHSIATEATVPLESPLQPGKTYYWRVRGGNEVGWSPWSEVHSFRVLEEIL